MHHISVTLHFRRCKLFFFWIPSVRRTICCHFQENRCYLIFSTLYNLNIYLWPLKPHNFKSMCRISKIITFLESLRQAGWSDLFESDIQALFIFDPLITLWGNFDSPYLKLLNDASVASACFYVRTCRRVRNSKKIATIRDFHLPGSFLCLSSRLQVNRRNRRVAPCSGLLQKIFNHFKDKEESLEVREGIFLLLNCSIHGVLPW